MLVGMIELNRQTKLSLGAGKAGVGVRKPPAKRTGDLTRTEGGVMIETVR